MQYQFSKTLCATFFYRPVRRLLKVANFSFFAEGGANPRKILI